MSFGIFAEQWRPVDGFDGYEVSNAGRVGSYLQTGPRGFRKSSRRILRPEIDKDGYPRYNVRCHGKQVHRMGHRLVLEAFIGPPPDGMECRHLNNVRSDNWLHNLRWSTHPENIADKTTHGTAQIGIKHAMAKLKDADVHAIRHRRSSGEKLADIAGDYGVSQSLVCAIDHRHVWRHI